MRRTLMSFCFSVVSYCYGMTWGDAIDAYDAPLIIREQYRAFASSEAPAIVDPRIKQIPIYENGEPLVDLRMIQSGRIEMLPDPAFPFDSPDCNSGLPSASKMRLALFAKLQRMVTSLDSLAPDFGYIPGQVKIKIFEGLRDLNTQKTLFDMKRDEILAAQPELTLEEAEKETSKWVSPLKNNVPVHSTGAAIDIRLWDNVRGEFLDMGAFGVIWGSNKSAPTYSENITDDQKRNRLYCLMAAERAGLTNYVFEFWHFSSEDRYAAYWNEPNSDLRRASYGSIE